MAGQPPEVSFVDDALLQRELGLGRTMTGFRLRTDCSQPSHALKAKPVRAHPDLQVAVGRLHKRKRLLPAFAAPAFPCPRIEDSMTGAVRVFDFDEVGQPFRKRRTVRPFGFPRPASVRAVLFRMEFYSHQARLAGSRLRKRVAVVEVVGNALRKSGGECEL